MIYGYSKSLISMQIILSKNLNYTTHAFLYWKHYNYLKNRDKIRYLSIFHLTFFIKILNPICLLQAPQRLICRRLHFWPSHSLRRNRNNAILLWVEFLRGGTTNINIWLIPWSDLTPWSRNWFLKMNFTIQRIQSTFQWEKKYNVGSRRWWRDQPCPKQIWN